MALGGGIGTGSETPPSGQDEAANTHDEDPRDVIPGHEQDHPRDQQHDEQSGRDEAHPAESRFVVAYAPTGTARARLELAELEFKRSLQEGASDQLGPPDLKPVK